MLINGIELSEPEIIAKFRMFSDEIVRLNGLLKRYEAENFTLQEQIGELQNVKRGHWDYSEKENGECAWYFCSCCDEPAEQLYNDNPLLSEFCPHCGADMR